MSRCSKNLISAHGYAPVNVFIQFHVSAIKPLNKASNLKVIWGCFLPPFLPLFPSISPYFPSLSFFFISIHFLHFFTLPFPFAAKRSPQWSGDAAIKLPRSLALSPVANTLLVHLEPKKRVWWLQIMTSGINIYYKLLVTRIRILGINNWHCWYQEFEFLILANRFPDIRNQERVHIPDINNSYFWCQQLKLLISTIPIPAIRTSFADITNSNYWYH